jgi:putative ATPase
VSTPRVVLDLAAKTWGLELMTLFDHNRRQREQAQAPLATRMRPRTLGEFVGQVHLLGPGHVLEKAIRSDLVPSMVLWGPPGSGKTTLAYLIASMTKAHFIPISAVSAGVADLRQAVAEAKELLGTTGQRTILFIDEVHRFNKAQQDAILPHVENGIVTFIAATTENPSFEVISALLSRSRVFALNSLTDEQLTALIQRTLVDKERGLGGQNVDLKLDALEMLLVISAGDARVALNAIELAVSVTEPGTNGKRVVDRQTMEEVMQRRGPSYDKAGNAHYDTISAYIKSVRASDPGAAMYWLARMIEAGEDPMFIARRMVILAAEDIGMADPQALPIAVAAQQAVHFIGFPEGAIPLAEATVYLATAPKSNTAYMALNSALEEVRKGREYPVPLHLRNAVTGLMRDMGYGKSYKYSHDHPGHFAGQQNLPEEISQKRFYLPSEEGYEREVAERVKAWWGNNRENKY